MVVVPAEGDEVVGIMSPVVGLVLDVVGLEPVAAAAAFNAALALVAPEDVGAEVGWDGFSQIGVGDRLISVGDDESDFAGAEDLGEGVGSDSGS